MRTGSPDRSPTERFSTRAQNYVRYRPGYPAAILDLLRAECGLTPAAVVADVGSGTGKLAELFLGHGNRVYGVEPNAAMRQAGERLLADFPNFTSIAAAAEATTLPAASVDFITAGQAFHWFDHELVGPEFARILRPGGWVVLVWNDRSAGFPFHAEYEALLETYAQDYRQVVHDNTGPDEMRQALGVGVLHSASFPNHQDFDLEGLQGRLLSSSYAPEPGHPNFAPMIESLTRLFHRHQTGGLVRFEYETQLFWTQLPQKSGVPTGRGLAPTSDL